MPIFQKRFYKDAEEVEKDVTVKVKNEFHPHQYAQYYNYPVEKNVCHVDTSGLPQFTANEKTVIELNKSRELYYDFEKIGGFDGRFMSFQTCVHRPCAYFRDFSNHHQLEERPFYRIKGSPGAELRTQTGGS
jgi:hypothetical protein